MTDAEFFALEDEVVRLRDERDALAAQLAEVREQRQVDNDKAAYWNDLCLKAENQLAEVQRERDALIAARDTHAQLRAVVSSEAERGEVVAACPQCRGDLVSQAFKANKWCLACLIAVFEPTYWQRVPRPIVS